MGISLAQGGPSEQMSVADVFVSRKSKVWREIKRFQILAPPKYVHIVAAKAEGIPALLSLPFPSTIVCVTSVPRTPQQHYSLPIAVELAT
ncbi:MAG: hypothetical protein ACXVDN_18490 [Ktedonobacteraceae bacterium]